MIFAKKDTAKEIGNPEDHDAVTRPQRFDLLQAIFFVLVPPSRTGESIAVIRGHVDHLALLSPACH
jgi:hypothetical protein